jgi:hypothetical protein
MPKQTGDKKYKRILLKLSGEALTGKEGFGIDPRVLDQMALLITNGDPEAAAELAMQDPHFYNTVLKSFITPWTNPTRCQSTIMSAVRRTTSANSST